MRKKLKAVLRSNTMRWALLLVAQASMFALAGIAAFMLRFEFHIPPMYARHAVYALSVWVIVKSIAFQIANLNRRGLRYVSMADVFRLLAANAAGSVISCALIVMLAPSGFPRSIYLSDLVLSVVSTMGLRSLARMVCETMQASQPATPERRAFIYGAGDAGITL